MTFVKFYNYTLFNGTLTSLTKKVENLCKLKKRNPLIINCMNPHSYMTSLKDYTFYKSILNTNLNIIDGVGIYLYLKLFRNLNHVNRITGYDIFSTLINKNLKLFFLGGNLNTTKKIQEKFEKKNVQCFSPSFSSIFSEQENKNIVKKINKFKPHILFVGMTAPKQEKWSYQNRHKLNCNCIINIGAVFDYYAENYYRAPLFFRKIGFEWFFRIVQQPRLWKRTFFSGIVYLIYVCFPKKKNSIFFDIIDSQKKINEIINKNKSFILSAFNLSFFSNIYNGRLKLNKYRFYWSDGIFCKLFRSEIKKIPGYQLINDIKIGNKYQSIHIIGNTDSKVNFFLKKKFHGKIINYSLLPFGSTKQLRRKIPKIKKNSLVLLTLPTPKQEIIADAILKKYPFSKIICIGGGLRLASGSEKKCPSFLSKSGLEFLWRLHSDTKRRIFRLSVDFLYFLKSLIKADICSYSYKDER